MTFKTPRRFAVRCCAVLLVYVIAIAPACFGYSVLTHEEIIDLLWKQQIQPLLLARFPNATPDDLLKAHAYAYGGSVIQDIGYYPFGSHVFSDLAHYVRTGDFVQALIADSQDLDEYAFALGALSHYVSDINGHPYINLSVGIEYPELARWYGPSVPYDVDHKAHLRTEFGFDVLQVAKGRYAPEDYHNFIGFEVAQSLLERAFYDTYGLKLTDVMPHEQLAINTYRRSISQIIPEMTKVALLAKGDQTAARKSRISIGSASSITCQRPIIRRVGARATRSLVRERTSWRSLFKVVPKVGPLRTIDFKEPTPKTENLYFKSVDQTVDEYGKALQEVKSNDLQAPEINLDTGKPTKRGEYPLADATYRELLDELAYDNFNHMDKALRDNIVWFYDGFGFPAA